MKFLFWFSVLIITYTYLGYPLIIHLLSLFYKKPLKGKYIYPTVSILMSVHNEEENIEEKILSLLSVDYPEERVEILIGSDGSTDKTDEIISKYINGRVKLFKQPHRQGKPSMLNILAREARSELLVFTDARQSLDKDALKELVKHFADPRVGSVSAELHFKGGEKKTGSGVGLYWEYEKFIRERESRMGSMLGATGALYAIKRELFPELPKDLILDDMYIPMTIVQRGYRAIFDPKSILYDRYPKSAKEEFLRKTRTLAGNFQLFTQMRWLFNPLKSPVAWQMFSHKFLRLVVPFLLVAIFITNFYILENNFYRITLILQIIFYALAFLGFVIKRPNPLLDVPRMFCVMNAAALVGLYRFLMRKQDVMWERGR